MDQQQNKNWWGRNWKWFVPVGCLSSMAIFLGGIALIICFVFGMMKSSDAYKNAVSEVKEDPAVQQSIGTPIEAGIFVTGNINISGTSGHANLAIPISGPDGKATIYVIASKSSGYWTFSKLVVKIKKTNQRIDLLAQKEEPNSAIDSDKQ